MIQFGELFDQSYEDMIVGAYRACLDSVDKGIDEDRIEAAWLGTCAGSLIRQEIVTGAALAEPIRFFPRPVTRIENACCTGSDAVRNAAFAIAAGVYDVVLVVGAEKMRDIPSRDSLIRQTSVMFHEWWAPRGATAPNRFGQFATAHMEAFGTERKHMAMIAEKNHHHGSLNPHSFFQRDVSCEQVLGAPIVSWPLGLLDCCPTTDGARRDRDDARRHRARVLRPPDLPATARAWPPIRSSARGRASSPSFPATTTAAERGLQDGRHRSGRHRSRRGARLLHDHRAHHLRGSRFLREGRRQGHGSSAAVRCSAARRPVNTSGGLKAKGHPIGATGVSQVVELWEQLRGEAGERQVEGARDRADPQHGRDRDDRPRQHLRIRADDEWSPHMRFDG